MVGAIGMNRMKTTIQLHQEHLPISEKPYWIQFYDATEDDKVTLGDIESDAEICLMVLTGT